MRPAGGGGAGRGREAGGKKLWAVGLTAGAAARLNGIKGSSSCPADIDAPAIPAGDCELCCEDNHWSLAFRQLCLCTLPPTA